MSQHKTPAIFEQTFRQVLAAILISTVLLFVAISLHVSAELKDELKSHANHTADMILAFADALPADRLKEEINAVPELPASSVDYALVVYASDKIIYASPANLALPHYSPHLERLQSGSKTYHLTHKSDPDRQIEVTIGISAEEAFFSSVEIVLITASIFFGTTLLMLYLTRMAIFRGLAPISKLASAVSDREPARMTKLDPNSSPPELRPIVLATNGLLDRLGAALQSERAFAANAAHELRTPLSGILAQAASVDLDALPKEAHGALLKIQESARRSSRKISQLLDHAFAHSQSMELPETRFQLAEMMQRLMIDSLPAAMANDVEIELDIKEDSEVELPEILLEIILRNLLDNAIKYGADNGRVLVSLMRKDEEFVIAIEDNGAGLTKQDFQLLSTRFQRASDVPGHGLGLTIVSELCARLDLNLGSSISEPLGGLKLEISGRSLSS